MTGALTVAMNQHLFSKELFLFFTSIAEYENICRIISKPTEKFDVERADGNRETQPGNYHCRLAWLRCNVSGITRVFLLLIGSCAGSAAWRRDSIMLFDGVADSNLELAALNFPKNPSGIHPKTRGRCGVESPSGMLCQLGPVDTRIFAWFCA